MPTHSSSISAASIPGSISARDGDATKLRLALAGSPSVTWCQSRYDSASASSSGSEGATAGVDRYVTQPWAPPASARRQ
jgi:hypothetical protein